MSLINIIKEISITSELIWIYRWNQLLQRVKTRTFLTLCSINLNIAFISYKGNVQPVLNLDPWLWSICGVTCWQQHKFYLVSLPNHWCPVYLVLNKPPQEKKNRCTEKMVTANTYLDMLQLHAVPQLSDGTIYQLHHTLPALFLHS